MNQKVSGVSIMFRIEKEGVDVPHLETRRFNNRPDDRYSCDHLALHECTTSESVRHRLVNASNCNRERTYRISIEISKHAKVILLVCWLLHNDFVFDYDGVC